MLSTLGGEGSPCAEAAREFLCYLMVPQCRYDTEIEQLRVCNTCSNVCHKYMDACDVSVLEALEGLATLALVSIEISHFLNFAIVF